jgi:hypothetical protein
MKKNLNITLLLVSLILGACQKDVRQQSEQNLQVEPTSAAKAKPPVNATVSLNVTLDNAAGNKILSDNGTAYIDGTDRVEAQILSSDGNFYMNTNNNTVKQPIRTMQFLPGTPGINLSGKRNYSLRTSAPLDPNINNGTVWIQNLGVYQSQLMCMRAWGVEQQGAVDWKLLFRNGPENNNNPSSLSDYVLVTRTAVDEWTIEPAGISSPAANAKLVNGSDGPYGPLDYYTTPFKLTLKKK